MRPSLEEQIAWKKKVDSMSDKELVDFLTLRHDIRGRIEFWLFRRSKFLWSLLNWNWFCIWCGKKHFSFSDKKCEADYFKKNHSE